MISAALLCLALNVYHEARSESFKGQVAVAEVTINRANKSNESICETVSDYKQFSWLNASYTPIWRWNHGRKVIIEQKLDPHWRQTNAATDEVAWQTAVNAARGALYGMYPDVTKGATYYHATYVKPKWSSEKDRVAQIGQHIFYRSKNDRPHPPLTFLRKASKVMT